MMRDIPPDWLQEYRDYVARGGKFIRWYWRSWRCWPGKLRPKRGRIAQR